MRWAVTTDKMKSIISRLASDLETLQFSLVTAESCTGGMLAATITSEPGSSLYFERGFITYSNKSKEDLLRVPGKTLKQYGAVSAETASAMAEGALTNSQSQIAVAITGVAGPGGGSEDKPCGTVFFAWAGDKLKTTAVHSHFLGDRDEVRQQAVQFALSNTISILKYCSN